MKYEIDQLSGFYNGLCDNYGYVVIVSLPFCAVTGPFRIVTKTLAEARGHRYRKTITKIKMWPHNKSSLKSKACKGDA